MSISTLTITKEYDDGTALTEAQLDAMKTSIESWAGQVAARAPDKSGTESISGIWTLTTPKITGAGAGVATVQYGNSGTNRTITLPDPGGDDSVAYLAATQTFTNKTHTSPTISGTVSGGATYASPIISGAPTTANALGVSTNTLTIGNGTAAIKCLREDGVTADTDTGAETLADNQATFTNVDGTNAALTFTVNAVGKYAVVFTFNTFIQSLDGDETIVLAYQLSDGTNTSNPVTIGYASPSTVGAFYTRMPTTIFHVFTYNSTGAKTVTLQYKSSTNSAAGSTCTFNDQTTFASICSMYAFRVAD